MDFITQHEHLIITIAGAFMALIIYIYKNSLNKYDNQIKDLNAHLKEQSAVTNAKIDNTADKIVNKVTSVENQLNDRINKINDQVNQGLHSIQLENKETATKAMNNELRISALEKKDERREINTRAVN